ncbi:MAG: dihydrofolate reductase family protein [Verrucomicrobia bacterium]|nr:dihydrofolate reductase family protein [Verrucomicrobiota bacterium]
MRKIIATAHLSLDGVMQGPGGAEEDTSDGFDLGGWIWQFSDDKAKAAIVGMVGSLAQPNDLLLGRRTYDIFAGFWPHAPADSPFGPAFNKANKYVLTHGNQKLGWANSHKLGSVDELKKVTAGEGPDIVLWGSSALYPPLLEANLIDGLTLLIYPIILGKGKKLFSDASHPVTMKLASSEVAKSGVIIAKYERV